MTKTNDSSVKCGICGRPFWWHLQKVRDDDHHPYMNLSRSKRNKGRWKWKKPKVKVRRESKRS